MDLLRESALLKRKDLKEMMSSLAMALPHAAKFASSYFVAEVGSADQVFHTLWLRWDLLIRYFILCGLGGIC